MQLYSTQTFTLISFLISEYIHLRNYLFYLDFWHSTFFVAIAFSMASDVISIPFFFAFCLLCVFSMFLYYMLIHSTLHYSFTYPPITLHFQHSSSSTKHEVYTIKTSSYITLGGKCSLYIILHSFFNSPIIKFHQKCSFK